MCFPHPGGSEAQYPEKTIIQKDTCTPMFIVALFTIAKTWKQPESITDEQIKKIRCVIVHSVCAYTLNI